MTPKFFERSPRTRVRRKKREEKHDDGMICFTRSLKCTTLLSWTNSSSTVHFHQLSPTFSDCHPDCHRLREETSESTLQVFHRVPDSCLTWSTATPSSSPKHPCSKPDIHNSALSASRFSPLLTLRPPMSSQMTSASAFSPAHPPKIPAPGHERTSRVFHGLFFSPLP